MSIARSISHSKIYSSALWLRDDSPGPIFSAGMPCISARSDKVGETNVSIPNKVAAFTKGCSQLIADACKRVDLALTSDCMAELMMSTISRLLYASVVRISTTKSQRSGITLCCVPALICVTVIFTSPSVGDVRSNLKLRSKAMSSSARNRFVSVVFVLLFLYIGKQ